MYIRCIPIYRYYDQYNRFSGWTRGTAPQEDKWSEFWKLYMRYKFYNSDIHIQMYIYPYLPLHKYIRFYMYKYEYLLQYV